MKTQGQQKWNNMTAQQQNDFKEKHGLHSSDPDPITLAKNDIELLNSGMSIFKDEIAWIEQPLRELGENQLWEILEFLAKESN